MGLDSPGPVSLLLTTQRRLGHSRDVSKFDAEAQQVAASEGHAQAPYLAAKARFKSSTFQTNLQNKPTCPLHLMSLQGFCCFSSVFLRHCSVRGFDCLVFCLLRHHAFSLRFLLVHYLFVTSLLYSGLRLSLPLFCYVSVGLLPFQGFRCFIIWLLRQCSVQGFDCLFFCLLRHYAFSSLFHCFIICLLRQ